jgi:hypothetical protein
MSNKYKIIDDGNEIGDVKIIAPDGEDITGKVSEYSVHHSAGEKARLFIRWSPQFVGECEIQAEIDKADTTDHTAKKGQPFKING